ncbi:hypothetical protein D3C71_1315900 [compost metagenome]
MLRIVGGKAAYVLVPEEEIPEIRFLMMDGQRPGQADGRGDHDSQWPVSQQLANAALPDHVGQGDHRRQQPGQKALGHEAHAAGNAQHCPGAQSGTGGAAVNGEPQADQAQVDPQGELRVEVGVPGLTGNQPEAHVQQCAGEAFARIVPQPAGNQAGQPHTHPGRQCRRDTHPEQIVAKHRLTDGDHPVPGNGFFEIAQAHEVRRNPVSAVQHFLADLGITGFIGNPQAVAHQRQQVERHERQEQGQ